MSNNRPTHLDLRSQSHGPLGSSLSPLHSPRGLGSPRLHHVAGNIPPELSPLDAFAAQSRMLAKQLEDSANSGRRMSRLPPLTIANSLQSRPNYFRSMSAEAPRGNSNSPPHSPLPPSSGQRPTAVEEEPNRPMSVHPSLHGPLPTPSPPPPPMPHLDRMEDEFRGRRPSAMTPSEGHGYFGGRREQSPVDLERDQRFEHMFPPSTSPGSQVAISNQQYQSSRRIPDTLGVGYDLNTLLPPRSPFARASSPGQVSTDGSEDDESFRSRNRTFSNESAISASPISQSVHSIRRTPSIASEISIGSTHLPRPAFNFSRPLSRASMAGTIPEPPSRQASSDSQPSFVLADDTANTPVSMHSEGFQDASGEAIGAPSYVYSKFSLPRGKILQRNSLIFQESLAQAKFTWEQPAIARSNVQLLTEAPPSPPSRPSTSSMPNDSRPSLDPGRPSTSSMANDSQLRPSLDPGRPSMSSFMSESVLARPSVDPGRPSLDPGRPSNASAPSSREPSQTRLPPSRLSESNDAESTSTGSNGTIKPTGRLKPASELTGEENVARAIEFHEQGSLTKSTYHLRLAARQNHPTGMLLYALACRHGWGMRPNQKEGVVWLRKAADSASLEVADGEDLVKDGRTLDVMEMKTRKAQFALSIYELGVSHMNGWGIDQDKGLALRCFEIAGTWGDADALAEAGFCYAQGIGCKKDLKKSARFYRAAESKGISMIGNSWIYKPKYAEDGQAPGLPTPAGLSSPEKDKKLRDKSRTRGRFGKKKMGA